MTQRSIQLTPQCPVCANRRWVLAYPVVRRVTGEGERAVVTDVGCTVPCFCRGAQ